MEPSDYDKGFEDGWNAACDHIGIALKVEKALFDSDLALRGEL